MGIGLGGRAKLQGAKYVFLCGTSKRISGVERKKDKYGHRTEQKQEFEELGLI